MIRTTITHPGALLPMGHSQSNGVTGDAGVDVAGEASVATASSAGRGGAGSRVAGVTCVSGARTKRERAAATKFRATGSSGELPCVTTRSLLGAGRGDQQFLEHVPDRLDAVGAAADLDQADRALTVDDHDLGDDGDAI